MNKQNGDEAMKPEEVRSTVSKLGTGPNEHAGGSIAKASGASKSSSGGMKKSGKK